MTAKPQTTALTIADNLTLPIDAITQKFAFLARSGAGKTYSATKLCELMLQAGAQVVALDVVGVWYGLRLSADGKGNGFAIPVFGGEHGDLPLTPNAGALIADLIVDKGICDGVIVSRRVNLKPYKPFTVLTTTKQGSHVLFFASVETARLRFA